MIPGHFGINENFENSFIYIFVLYFNFFKIIKDGMELLKEFFKSFEIKHFPFLSNANIFFFSDNNFKYFKELEKKLNK